MLLGWEDFIRIGSGFFCHITNLLISLQRPTLRWGRAYWGLQWRARLGSEWIFESEWKQCILHHHHHHLHHHLILIVIILNAMISIKDVQTWIIVSNWGICPSLAPAKKSLEEVRSWPLTAPIEMLNVKNFIVIIHNYCFHYYILNYYSQHLQRS